MEDRAGRGEQGAGHGGLPRSWLPEGSRLARSSVRHCGSSWLNLPVTSLHATGMTQTPRSSYLIIFSPDTLLLSKSGEGPGVFSSIKIPVTLDRWHQAEITGWAGRIQVTLDDKVVMDVLDQQPLQQGTIGLSPFLGDPDALVDDIEVMPAGPEPLQPPPPTEPSRPAHGVAAASAGNPLPTGKCDHRAGGMHRTILGHTEC